LKKKIVLIGSEGLVGKSFQKLYSEKYHILTVDKYNSITEIENLNDIDTIVFLAQSEDYKNPVLTENLFQVNVELLFKTLMRFKNTNTKFIHFSTGSVYKNNQLQLKTDSPLDYTSTNPYVLSKIMGEKCIQSFSNLYKSIDIVRPFFIYGPAQNPQMLFSVMIDKIKKNEPIQLSGEKGLIFNPIYCDDVSKMIDTLIHSSKSNNKIEFHNAAGKNINTLHDMLTLSANILGVTANIEITGNQDTQLIAEIDSSFFNLEINLEQGLRKTILNE